MRVSKNVENWERVASVALGAGLIAMAVRRRHPVGQLSGTGLALIARGTSGYCPVNAATGRHRRRDDTRDALGGPRGLVLEESITIARPQGEVYEFWNDPRNLPRVMEHIEQVELLENGNSHWVARGPAGVRVEWDAEVINAIPPELIAWRSLPGADVASAGSVHFRARRGHSTEVTVRMQYNPPGGKAGAAVAWLTGSGARTELREDLRRLKQLLETGEVPTVEGQPAGRRTRTFSLFKRAYA
jgi:uncharacterized membrane protein